MQTEKSYWELCRPAWEETGKESDYRKLTEIHRILAEDPKKAAGLLQEFIEDLKAFQRFRLKTLLKELLFFRLHWETEPEIRTGETALEIFKLTDEFGQILSDNPDLGENYAKSIWAECLTSAQQSVKLYFDKETEPIEWKDVFDFEYKTF